jgi:D-tyrosyl-tRNA(Tyr) deacylase
MRAVLQRVSRSTVTADGRTVARIDRGVLVLLGVERGDTESDVRYLLDKTVNLRVFEDDDGKMNHSLLEAGGSLLVVSQFTLLGDVRKGRRPSFVDAEEPEKARRLYELFMSLAKEEGVSVSGGVFQAMMDVSLVNNGPVTIIIDSRKRF